MRNLLGRLNARSVEELLRIAAAWRIPTPNRDRAALLGLLVREMVDIRSVRDQWEWLPAPERDLVGLLAVAEEAPELSLTIREMAALLNVEEPEARTTATHLYQKGILARAGGSQPLLIDEQPKLFMPRELAALFRRVQDEIDAGDVSNQALAVFIELFDDADIQQAAELWGYDPVPGLRTRSELTSRLLALTAQPEKRALVESRLGWDARRIYRLVRGAAPRGLVQVSAIANELNISFDDPRLLQRFRQGLGELEEALLVIHTYGDGESRWLFATVQESVSEPANSIMGPELVPVDERVDAEIAWKHPAAIAWDLLTLARELGVGGRLKPVSAISLRRRQALNERLWMHGADEPPAGYLEFLAALGDLEGFLLPPADDDQSDAASRIFRLWRDRSFSEQMGHLLYWWLAAQTWIESPVQTDVVVSGAHWPQFRRKLLVVFAELVPGEWYRLETATRWLAARCEDALGETLEVATARPIDTELDPQARRRASVEQIVERTLRSSFTWFGLVDLGHVTGLGEVVRPLQQARTAAQSEPIAQISIESAHPIEVRDGLTILLNDPTPLRIWSLTAFADPESLEPPAQYRLTETSLRRALAAGFRLDDVTRFLTRQSRDAIPAHLATQLDAWVRAFAQVWLTPALVLEPEQPETRSEIREALEAGGYQVTDLDKRLIVDQRGARAEQLEAGIVEVLKSTGRSPQFRTEDDGLDDQASEAAADLRSTGQGGPMR